MKNLFNHFKKYSSKDIYPIAKNILIETKIKLAFNKLYKNNKYLEGTKEDSSKKLIISLTSYPARFQKLHLCLFSLLNQKIKPNKVILVLSKKEVEREDLLPSKILFLKKFGLEIRFVKENYRSYKKLVYTLKDFSDYNIITVDDDVIYPKWFLEKMLIKHETFPKDILCYRAHLIKKDGNKISPYLEWMKYDLKKFSQCINLFPTGVGGVLYPPGSLNKELFNPDIFMKLCPTADDVWFKAMSLLNRTNCRRVFENKNVDFISLRGTQEVALWKDNINLNDEQIKKVFRKYDLEKYIGET